MIMKVIKMTTIAIGDGTKRELLKQVSELQIKYGRKVNYDEAIKYLLTRDKSKDPKALNDACMEDADVKDLLDELYLERRKDEKRIERYTSI